MTRMNKCCYLENKFKKISIPCRKSRCMRNGIIVTFLAIITITPSSVDLCRVLGLCRLADDDGDWNLYAQQMDTPLVYFIVQGNFKLADEILDFIILYSFSFTNWNCHQIWYSSCSPMNIYINWVTPLFFSFVFLFHSQFIAFNFLCFISTHNTTFLLIN